MLDLFNKKEFCDNCRVKYHLYVNDGSVYSNITLDRIDNSLSHTKNNTSLLCNSCNCKKSNKY